MFGYPPICFSPHDSSRENQSQGPKNYLRILMRHVFKKNNALASVEDLIEAREKEDDFAEVL